MKKPIQIQPAGRAADVATVTLDVCDNCIFADPNKMEGATKVFCMRYPTTELKRVIDWCGEYKGSKP